MYRKLILILVSFVASLSAAEQWVRLYESPRWQRVKAIEMVGGVPTWRPSWDQTPVIRNTVCVKGTVDERADVVLMGDSIFYGVGTDPQESLAPSLDRVLLSRLGHPICTVNLAVPGYTFENERASWNRTQRCPSSPAQASRDSHTTVRASKKQALNHGDNWNRDPSGTSDVRGQCPDASFFHAHRPSGCRGHRPSSQRSAC